MQRHLKSAEMKVAMPLGESYKLELEHWALEWGVLEKSCDLRGREALPKWLQSTVGTEVGASQWENTRISQKRKTGDTQFINASHSVTLTRQRQAENGSGRQIETSHSRI